MAVNKKISELTALTAPASGDLSPLVDVSDTTDAASGTTKKVTLADLLKVIFEDFALAGRISPAQITSNQDDYNPPGLADATVLRLSTDASRNLTSIAGGSDGRVLLILNVGSNNLVLKDDDGATGTAANRFALNGDVTLGGDQGAIIWYDSTSSRWRIFATSAALGGAPSGAAGGDLTGTYPNPTLADDVVDAAALAPADVNAQTDTTYTLLASDNGKVVTCSNASAITVTVPSGLGAGFNCMVIQIGAGQVTFSPSSTTVNNRQSHTKIAGQYGAVSLVAYAADTFVLAGDTSA